jgi:hypothetical protein
MRDDIGFHVGVMAGGMAALEIADLVFELVDRQSGFDSLIVDNRLISVVVVNVLGGVSHRGRNRLTLNDGLNRLVDVVMRFVVDICSALDLLCLGGGNLLLIGESMVLLIVTTSVFFGHFGLMMTMFGLEVLMLVLSGKNLLVGDRLNPVLVMMNIVLTSNILVQFLRLLRPDGFVSDIVFDV